MPEHNPEVTLLLRKMGLSTESELTPDEESRLPEIRARFIKNPTISRDVLYRILRPAREDDWD